MHLALHVEPIQPRGHATHTHTPGRGINRARKREGPSRPLCGSISAFSRASQQAWRAGRPVRWAKPRLPLFGHRNNATTICRDLSSNQLADLNSGAFAGLVSLTQLYVCTATTYTACAKLVAVSYADTCSYLGKGACDICVSGGYSQCTRPYM